MKKFISLVVLLLMSGCGMAIAQAQTKTDSASVSSTDFTTKAWQKQYAKKKSPSLFQKRIEIQQPLPQSTESLMAWTARFNSDLTDRINRRFGQMKWYSAYDGFASYQPFSFNFPPLNFEIGGITP